MENAIEKISKSFVDDNKERTSQQKIDRLTEELRFIFLFAKEPNELFADFVAWQKELLRSLDIPYSLFKSLCQKTLDLGMADLSEAQVKNISCVVEDNLSVINIDNALNQSDQVAEFHFKLFMSLETALLKPTKENYQKYAQQILEYLNLAEIDAASFEHFIEWQAHLFAALNIEKLSLVRLLISIKLFVDEPQKAILDHGIRYLVANEDLKRGIDRAIQTDEISVAITNRHIQLFNNIDSYSKEGHRDSIKSDVDKHLLFLNQALQIESKVLFP